VSEQEDKPLEKMTKAELRTYAEDHGLRITYVAQRSQETLVRLIRKALKDKAG
jgi:hypothetical protein